MTPSLSNRRSNSPFRRRSAFTLLEMMMVVVIIVLLLGFAVSKLKGNLDFAKDTRIKGDIQSIATQLLLYESSGSLPSAEQGLKALVEKPQTEPRPRNWRQLLPEVPRDPYGREYQYLVPGRHNTDGYDLFSMGRDGAAGTADDVGNWENK